MPVGPALPSTVIQLRNAASLRTKRPPVDLVGYQTSCHRPSTSNPMSASSVFPFDAPVQVRVIEAPPSTSEAVPVTKAASSEARYSTDRANSSRLSTRFSAGRLLMELGLSGVSFLSPYRSGSAAPG